MPNRQLKILMSCRPPSSGRYGLAVLVVVAVLVAIYLIGLCTDTEVFRADSLQGRSAWVIATICVGLLTVDVLLPVPSSLLMVGAAATLGFWNGVAVSLIGTMAAALLGYWFGYSSKGSVARILSPDELARGEDYFSRWGTWAVLLSRPIPVAAETVSIFAGLSNLPMWTFLLAAFAGNLPTTVLLCAVGTDLVEQSTARWFAVFTCVVAIGLISTRALRPHNNH